MFSENLGYSVRVPVCGSCGNVNFHNSLCGTLSQQWVKWRGSHWLTLHHRVWSFQQAASISSLPFQSPTNLFTFTLSLWLTCSGTLVWLYHELIFSLYLFSSISFLPLIRDSDAQTSLSLYPPARLWSGHARVLSWIMGWIHCCVIGLYSSRPNRV